MRDQLFKEVALNEITPNPFTPRKNFKGPKFDELVRVFLESGVDLAGVVPEEILKD